MLQDARLNEIIKLVEEKGAVKVADLATYFQTSRSTIRRNLQYLASINRINKVPGGATALNYTGNINFDVVDKDYFFREQEHNDKKVLIAKRAAQFITDGAAVYLDSSTSVAAMIDFLPKTNKVYYVTNSSKIAHKLANKGIKAFVTGGELKLTTDAYTGGYALEFLDKFNFTMGFFGTNGIHSQAQFTTPDPVEAAIKKKAISKTYKVYILADSSKFNNIGSVTFAKLNEATLITDKAPKEYKDQMKIIDLSEEKAKEEAAKKESK